MRAEQVDALLRGYRRDVARCAFIEQEIVEREALIEELKRTAVADAVSTTARVTGMPRGTNTGDPTARLGAMLADGEQPRHIRQVEEEARALEAERRFLRARIRRVDALMGLLSERERCVIQGNVIDGMKWREVILAYRERFGIEYSRDGIRRIRDGAMEKMYAVAGCGTDAAAALPG